MTAINHPRSVVTGVSILYVSLLLGFIGGIINIIHVWVGLPALDMSATPAQAPFGVGEMWGIVLVSTAIGWFIISRINHGANWARCLYAILVIIGLIVWATNFRMAMNQGIFTLISSIINTLLGLIGSVCLFTPESNTWFKTKGH
jgi:hypothetical protein